MTWQVETCVWDFFLDERLCIEVLNCKSRLASSLCSALLSSRKACRINQTIRYGVDPTSGDVGNSLIDNTWYDAAGNVIKSLPSGSQLFTKSFYDGLGRVTFQYMGHNVEETGYPEPDVDEDTIMEQVESLYDDASNVIEAISRQRYHNASGTGALVDPSSEPKARVTYMASYPDAIGRNQASADYGTNGGSPLSRPDTIPARADTILISSMLYDSAGNVESSTDPAGVVTCFFFDDLGREVQRVMNCITSSSSSSDCGCGCPNAEDCAESDDQNVTIETTYNSDGNVSTITAVNADTGNQVTQYTYGTTLADSDIASSLLKRFEAMPDSTGSDDRLKFAYNRQGEIVSLADQNENVHEYVYDGLGRQIADRVSTVGSGVNDAVLRISSSYEVRGVPLNITSHDEASAGSVVNDVQREYNDFAQLVAEYQSHSGAVNTMTTPKCQYQYEDGSGNTIRPTALVYPNGRVLSYIYEDALSRITSIVDQDDQHLVDYSYLGLSSIIETESPEPGLVSTLIGIDGGDDPDTGDVYRGLDRFARVKDLIWTSAGSGSSSSSSSPATVVDRIQHGYDRASNRIWRAQLADPERRHDEFYTYDRLHRLKRMDRGTLNSGKTAIENPTFGQCWSLDATGNWRGFKEDKQGDGKWDLVQSRSANAVNEITSIKTHTSGLPMALPAPLGGRVGRGLWVQPRYDKNGNMVRMPRPAEPTKGFDAVYDAWNRLVSLEGDVGQYAYDGLRRRTVKVALGETRHFYYSPEWQVLEERVGASTDADRQFVWGRRYIDNLLLRDRFIDSEALRTYSTDDPNTNIVTAVDTSGSVLERYAYTPYGLSQTFDSQYNVRSSSNIDWENRYASYRADLESSLYCVRMRFLHSKVGGWVQRDRIGLSGGSNLLRYAANTPINATDPNGEDIYYVLDPTAAGGFGHAALVIGPTDAGLFFQQRHFDPKTMKVDDVLVTPPVNRGKRPFIYVSVGRDPALFKDKTWLKFLPLAGGVPIGLDVEYYTSFEDFFYSDEGKRYSVAVRFTTGKDQDKAVVDFIGDKWGNAGYRLLWRNCSNLVIDALITAGSIKDTPLLPGPNTRALLIAGLETRKDVQWYIRTRQGKLERSDGPALGKEQLATIGKAIKNEIAMVQEQLGKAHQTIASVFRRIVD